MEKISPLQWRFEETPERSKIYNITRMMLGAAFYLSGLVYALIVYSNYQETGEFNKTLAVVLSAVYVVEILVWNFYIKELVVFKEKFFTISEEGVEILTIADNKREKYPWEELSSFSDNVKVYMKKQQNNFLTKASGNDKYYFLGFKKFSFTPYAILMATEANKNRVYQILKSKLPEKH